MWGVHVCIIEWIRGSNDGEAPAASRVAPSAAELKQEPEMAFTPAEVAPTHDLALTPARPKKICLALQLFRKCDPIAGFAD